MTFKSFISYISAVLAFYACSPYTERITVSDTESLGLRYRVQSMEEEFFIARNSFDKVIPDRSLYRFKYSFDYRCRFTDTEHCYSFPGPCEKDTAVLDTVAKPDSLSVQKLNPRALSEPHYTLDKYRYMSDSLVLINTYDENKNLISYEEKRYEQGRLRKTGKFSATDDTLVSKESFLYDVNNRLSNKTVFYPKSYTETRYKYSGNKKYESYNYTFTNFVYSFNLKGFLIEKKTYSGNTLLSITRYLYNKCDDVTTERETDMVANVVKETVYEYEYDFKGNWTTCVERKPDGNIFMRKRKITYY